MAILTLQDFGYLIQIKYCLEMDFLMINYQTINKLQNLQLTVVAFIDQGSEGGQNTEKSQVTKSTPLLLDKFTN